ncbi:MULTISPECIES: hypothetical protein [Psychrilyobacter]|uniref:Uncharacterized protein n=1 Tax=Psychrilyobacter piezotolerans TaxID=2293438 RepID=A0ABX9KJV5_9FUSO|nr:MULTISPECIES: hypothetical protein [Psychrilyobacter]MCS5421258.1 hypothetical protein [Psychrilyobacter sp. S5]NDI76985.1 hypothetical protein [Psychrilyobacter piezotolerans]RDE64602.1 hypothetical protein DV867_03415 [Psychrilyobacter sp. S5]REI42414.1 hypothetical protein DYH56_03415 [Psychrilyobacter piezotolerans]
MAKETITPENLKAGGVVPYLVEPMGFTAGIYTRGMLLELDPATLKLSKCTDETKFFGVLSEDVVVTGTETAMVYVSGMFYKTGVIKEDATDIEKIRIHGIPKNIYMR